MLRAAGRTSHPPPAHRHRYQPIELSRPHWPLFSSRCAERDWERHYYISSLDGRTRAKRLAGYVRGHWSVENNLHWQLAVSFREDERRIRKGHGAENFSRLCRMALNLLKSEASAKVGMACKRRMCGWDNDYLLRVVMA